MTLHPHRGRENRIPQPALLYLNIIESQALLAPNLLVHSTFAAGVGVSLTLQYTAYPVGAQHLRFMDRTGLCWG